MSVGSMPVGSVPVSTTPVSTMPVRSVPVGRARSLSAALALAACVFGAASCGGVAPATAPAPPPAPAPTPSAVASAAPTPAAPTAALPAAPAVPLVPMPPAIEPPAVVACSWSTAALVTDPSLGVLRLRPGGPAFVEFRSTLRGRLQLPADRHDHAIADILSNGLVLTGVLDASQVVLHPARPFAMNKVVYPQRQQRLSWTGSEPAKVTVSTQPPDWLKVARPPLTATVSCGDVSLDGASLVRVGEHLFGQKTGLFQNLPTGRLVEVYSEIGKPADARVIFPSGMDAQSFKSERGFTFVTIELDQVAVAGWVRSQNLTPAGGGMGRLGAIQGLSGWIERPHPPIAKVVCPASVPVAAEVSADPAKPWGPPKPGATAPPVESAKVGEILGGTVIEIFERRGDFSSVFVKTPNVRLRKGAVLLARAAELAACSPAPP
ncbi:MAG: hypothetical protein U0441_37720 [Polyangiaceae bacterium]